MDAPSEALARLVQLAASLGQQEAAEGDASGWGGDAAGTADAAAWGVPPRGVQLAWLDNTGGAGDRELAGALVPPWGSLEQQQPPAQLPLRPWADAGAQQAPAQLPAPAQAARQAALQHPLLPRQPGGQPLFPSAAAALPTPHQPAKKRVRFSELEPAGAGSSPAHHQHHQQPASEQQQQQPVSEQLQLLLHQLLQQEAAQRAAEQADMEGQVHHATHAGPVETLGHLTQVLQEAGPGCRYALVSMDVLRALHKAAQFAVLEARRELGRQMQVQLAAAVAALGAHSPPQPDTLTTVMASLRALQAEAAQAHHVAQAVGVELPTGAAHLPVAPLQQHLQQHIGVLQQMLAASLEGAQAAAAQQTVVAEAEASVQLDGAAAAAAEETPVPARAPADAGALGGPSAAAAIGQPVAPQLPPGLVLEGPSFGQALLERMLHQAIQRRRQQQAPVAQQQAPGGVEQPQEGEQQQQQQQPALSEGQQDHPAANGAAD